jgi:hypothetical protein
MQSSQPRLRIGIVALAMVTGILGGAIGVAFASHQFPDVPDTQPHHDNINALVDAGCATGFNNGTYRPGDPVTRGQVARQVVQCGTRVGQDTTSANDPADGVNTIAALPLTPGGSGANTGFVLLLGNASFTGDETADCPCRLTVEVRDVVANDVEGTQTMVIDGDEDCFLGVTCGNAQTFALYSADPSTGGGGVFEARARLSTAGDNTGYTVNSRVVAMYIPFDGNPLD